MNDLEYSKMRLNNILKSHKLNYNPFEVSNAKLISTFNTYTWGNSFEITDCVIMEFKELRKCEWINPSDAVVYTIGFWSDEKIISVNRFLYEIKANDSKEILQSTLDGRVFGSKQQVKSLVGSTTVRDSR